MKPRDLLHLYQSERERLLRSISELLSGDPSVQAAWLVGSLGRGEADALSDIDLWVVVEDAGMEAVTAGPRAFVSQAGEPVLYLDAPQNAPLGGAYAMACYDAPVAPHIVDWYWQPRSLAAIPSGARLLFDRIGLPQTGEPFRIQDRPVVQETIESPAHFTGFFWMMLMIAAKRIYRAPWQAELELLPHLIAPVVKARQVFGQSAPQLPDKLPQRTPSEKMQLLWWLADQMSLLMKALTERGEAVPDPIVPGAIRYLRMIESALEAEGE